MAYKDNSVEFSKNKHRNIYIRVVYLQDVRFKYLNAYVMDIITQNKMNINWFVHKKKLDVFINRFKNVHIFMDKLSEHYLNYFK